MSENKLVPSENEVLKEWQVPDETIDPKNQTPEVAAIEGLKKTGCVSKTLIGIVSIPVLIYFVGMRSEISELKEKLTLRETQLQQTTENFGKLSAAISEQNQMISRAAEAAEAASMTSQVLGDEIEQKTRESEDAVNKILRSVKPKSCDEALNYLISGVEDLKW